MSEEQHLGDRDPVEKEVQSVPDSWDLIDFESAFELVSANDRKVPSSEYLSEGPLPVVDQGQQFIGGFTDKVDLAIEPGEGLLVFGDHTRIFKPIDFPFAAGADGIKILRPRVASMKYCFYACSSLQFPNKGYARHYSHLRKCKLPVAPQQEQTRIVSKIDELFSQIENGERALDRVRKLVERYRQSVLKAAVTGELTREWREQHAGELESGEALLTRILDARRKAWETAELAKMTAKGQRPANGLWKRKYEEPSCPDVNDLPELPIGWIWSSLGQLFKVTGGSTPSRKEASYWGGKIPWVSSGEVAFCRISETAERITEAGFSNSSVKLHPEGTVLLAMIGEGKTRGQAAILDIPACHNQNAASIGVSATPIPPEYVYYFLKFQYEKTRAIGQGGNQPALNGEIVKAMPMPLPPLKEIVAICEQLEVQMEYISQIDTSLQPQAALVAAQRQSILREAFAGRLVPQDTSDEPAAVLLEHITAARSASPKLTSTKQGRHKKVNA